MNSLINTRKARTAESSLVEPGATTNTFHYNILNDALNIDVGLFCREMAAGARNWLNAVENTPRFRANYDKFARRYPNGLAPYLVGARW